MPPVDITPLGFLEEFAERQRNLADLRAEEEARRAQLDPAGGGLTVGEMEERMAPGVGFAPAREEFLGRERLTALGPEIAGREFAEERLQTAREAMFQEPRALNQYLATILEQGTPQEQEYALAQQEQQRKTQEEQQRFERGERAKRQYREEYPTAGDIKAREAQLDQELVDEFVRQYPGEVDALYDMTTGKLRPDMMAKLRSFKRQNIPYRFDEKTGDIVPAAGPTPGPGGAGQQQAGEEQSLWEWLFGGGEQAAPQGDIRAREAPGRQAPRAERWERTPEGTIRRVQ